GQLRPRRDGVPRLDGRPAPGGAQASRPDGDGLPSDHGPAALPRQAPHLVEGTLTAFVIPGFMPGIQDATISLPRILCASFTAGHMLLAGAPGMTAAEPP